MKRHGDVPLFLYIADQSGQLDIGFGADAFDALDVFFALEGFALARCDDGLGARVPDAGQAHEFWDVCRVDIDASCVFDIIWLNCGGVCFVRRGNCIREKWRILSKIKAIGRVCLRLVGLRELWCLRIVGEIKAIGRVCLGHFGLRELWRLRIIGEIKAIGRVCLGHFGLRELWCLRIVGEIKAIGRVCLRHVGLRELWCLRIVGEINAFGCIYAWRNHGLRGFGRCRFARALGIARCDADRFGMLCFCCDFEEIVEAALRFGLSLAFGLGKRDAFLGDPVVVRACAERRAEDKSGTEGEMREVGCRMLGHGSSFGFGGPDMSRVLCLMVPSKKICNTSHAFFFSHQVFFGKIARFYRHWGLNALN